MFLLRSFLAHLVSQFSSIAKTTHKSDLRYFHTGDVSVPLGRDTFLGSEGAGAKLRVRMPRAPRVKTKPPQPALVNGLGAPCKFTKTDL